MATKLKKFTRLPITVNAIQYMGDNGFNHEEIVALLGRKCVYDYNTGDNRSYIIYLGKDNIETKIGDYDYLVKYPGENYYRRVDPDTFIENFEEVEV